MNEKRRILGILLISLGLFVLLLMGCGSRDNAAFVERGRASFLFFYTDG